MPPATDRPRPRPRLFLLPLVGLTAAGCASFPGRGSSDPAPLTSPAPAVARAGRGHPSAATVAPPTTDLYAQAMERGRPASEAALARAALAAPAETAPAVLVRSTAPPPGALLLAGEPGNGVGAALAPPQATADVRLPALDAPSGGDSPPAPTLPAAAPGSEEEATALRGLLDGLRARLAGIGTYQIRLNRQERVESGLQPPEDVVVSIRRDPKAVRIEWPDGPHKGREAIYSAADDPGTMHVLLADSVIPLPPLKLPLDSPRVRANSRHPISEAGFDSILANLDAAFARRGASAEALTYKGLEQAEGLDRPAHRLDRMTPDGERWTVFLDPVSSLPALVHAEASNGDLLEHDVFRDVKVDLPDLAATSAFDPRTRWGNGSGLFQRLARGASSGPDTPAR